MAKSRDEKQRITVGLDIGTSKVCALVASPGEENNSLNILGIGVAESQGLSRGVVNNIDKTVRTIKKAVEEAENQSGVEIDEVIVGIAGDHIDSFQSKGVIGVPSEEINEQDVARVVEESKKIKIDGDRKILHVIPQEYIIDGQDGVLDPVGMSGVRLEANVHIVTGQKTSIQNIYKCVERNDIKVKALVLEPLASSYAVLQPDEKEVGVAIVDIGGGTTDIAIFEENVIRFTSVIGVAGQQVTNDIRKALGIVASEAERIKKVYGHCDCASIKNNQTFMIPGVGGRKPTEIDKQTLCEIIQPRMQEIYEFALAEIQKAGYAGVLGAGVILTGGSSLIKGSEELAQKVFGMPAKIGFPSKISYSGLAQEIESPIYSTVAGLALYGLLNFGEEEGEGYSSKEKKDKKGGLLKKVADFFKDI